MRAIRGESAARSSASCAALSPPGAASDSEAFALAAVSSALSSSSSFAVSAWSASIPSSEKLALRRRGSRAAAFCGAVGVESAVAALDRAASDAEALLSAALRSGKAGASSSSVIAAGESDGASSRFTRLGQLGLIDLSPFFFFQGLFPFAGALISGAASALSQSSRGKTVA